ncbi:MAG TPA: hypothetical protein VIM53_00090 [Candidatus Saccharimonadales bacterium]
MFALAIAAVVACALCNGIAAVLQKIGADKQRRATSLDVRLLARLTRSAPYVAGLALDLLGWILTVFAVRFIPLFLAQAVIATNVAVTALIERSVLKRALPRSTWRWLAVLLAGLVCLGASATRQNAIVVRGALEWGIVVTPIVCLGFGALLTKAKGKAASFALASLSGVAFGGTSVVGRVLPVTAQWWHLLASPLLWALVLYGLAGVWLFTIALQRSFATTVNASMTAAQTLAPAVVGLTLLNDTVRGDTWILLVIGMAAALVGVVGVAKSSEA